MRLRQSQAKCQEGNLLRNLMIVTVDTKLPYVQTSED